MFVMEQERPLISVIVPVYNVEKYLRRCVDSLLNQTYPNLEIILVNDGSTDNSWKICQEYERAQMSVKALKKSNGGLSSARNSGINVAQGRYIGFVDSDDWIEPDMYEYLYSLIRDNNAEASQVEYELAYYTGHTIKSKSESLDVLTGRGNILKFYMEQTTRTGLYSVCICLFEATFAKRYKFREGKTSEDMDYKFRVLSDCSCFISSNLAKYYYFQAGSSTSSGLLTKKNFELFESADVLYNLTAKEKDDRIRFLGEVKRARTAFSLLSKGAFYGLSGEIDKETIKRLKREHRSNLLLLLRAPIPLSRKAVAILLGIDFNLTRGLVSSYKYMTKGRM